MLLLLVRSGVHRRPGLLLVVDWHGSRADLAKEPVGEARKLSVPVHLESSSEVGGCSLLK